MDFNFEELARDQTAEQANEAFRNIAKTAVIYYQSILDLTKSEEVALALTKQFNQAWLTKIIGPQHV